MTKEEAIAVFECLATEMTAILAGIPKSEAAANQIKRYIDAYDIAISALRIKQKQESECTKCSGIMYTSSPTLIDLRGKTFGKLKVIEKDPDSKPGKAKWICECKCGNIVSVLSDSLRNGKTRSCGCARSQIKHDLTNQTFGFLKVIEPVKNERIKGNETRWKCLCQNCGRTVEVSSYWLRHSDPYGHCKCTRFNKPL